MTSFYLDPQTDKRYTLGKAFAYGDINYTTAGATHKTFTDLGFVLVEVEPRPSSDFYIVGSVDSEGKYPAMPRDLDELKVKFIDKSRKAANQILNPTDWYYARQVELGSEVAPVPQDISDFRAATRLVFHNRKDAINACETIEELQALIEGRGLEEWVQSPEATL